jgi:hypothetical protein
MPDHPLSAPYGTSPPVKGDPYKLVGEEIHRRAEAWIAAAPNREERTRRKADAFGMFFSVGNIGRRVTVKQSDGTDVTLTIGASYWNKRTREVLELVKVEVPTGREVNAMFLTKDRVEVWKDISWNFHHDYAPVAPGAEEIYRDMESAKREAGMLERRRQELAVREALLATGKPLALTELVGRARARCYGAVRPWMGGFDRLREQRKQIEQAVARLTAEGDLTCTPFRQYHLYDLAVRPGKAT